MIDLQVSLIGIPLRARAEVVDLWRGAHFEAWTCRVLAGSARYAYGDDQPNGEMDVFYSSQPSHMHVASCQFNRLPPGIAGTPKTKAEEADRIKRLPAFREDKNESKTETCIEKEKFLWSKF